MKTEIGENKKMNSKQKKILNELYGRYSVLKINEKELEKAFTFIAESYRMEGKLLVAGNGGSAADSEHIVGELMKGFVKKRKISETYAEALQNVDKELGKSLAEKLQGALPAISLVGHPGLATAYLNDVDPVLGFAQQVNGYGKEGDVLFAITTSGNSRNILYAAVAAKAKGMKVIGLTGRDGGKIKDFADVAIIVDEKETFKIQELHLPIYHALCLMIEEEFFEE